MAGSKCLLGVVVLLLCVELGYSTTVSSCATSNTNSPTTANCDSSGSPSPQSACIRPIWTFTAENSGAFDTTAATSTFTCATSACTGSSPDTCIQCNDAANCNSKDNLYSCPHYKYVDNVWALQTESGNTATVSCDPYSTGSLQTATVKKCVALTPDAPLSYLPTATYNTQRSCNKPTAAETANCPTATASTGTQCRTCTSGTDCDNLRYCKVGTATTAAAYDALPWYFCTTASVKCTRPVIVNGIPVDTAMKFGCLDENSATCTDTTKCSTCSTTGCNTWPAAGSDYVVKCYTWTWSDDKWTKSSSATACSTPTAGPLPTSCSLPKDRNTKDGFTAGGGCGACTTANANTCLNTIAEKNSGYIPTASVLGILLLISLLF